MNVPGTVLLVEHDEQLANNVRSELETRGHVVLDGDPMSSMHDMTVATHPDIVILDADLPNAMPQRLLSEMERDGRTAEVPVVLLGAQESHRSWSMGHDMVEKPVSANVLISRVETNLELSRLRHELSSVRQNNDVGGHIDPLTGLNGGRRMRDELSHHAATVKRYGGHLAIVLFDLDRFESTNEHFGRDAGDFVLCEVGQRLLADVRTSDVVGRWRADQFMAILPCTSVAGAAFFAERFRQVLSEMPVQLANGGCVSITASFGCSEGNDEIDIVQAAESAIGLAKRRGRNGVVTAKPSAILTI